MVPEAAAVEADLLNVVGRAQLCNLLADQLGCLLRNGENGVSKGSQKAIRTSRL